MTQEQRGQVARIIDLTATYYGRKLETEVVSMMIDDLSDLSITAVLEAYAAYRRNPKNKFFPLPAQIREIICPEVSNEALARQVVDQIKIAIRDFGYSNPKEAQLFLGSIGWEIVRGLGGWLRVCESDFITNQGLVAQARQRAVDLTTHGNQISEMLLASNESNKQSLEHLVRATPSKMLEQLYNKIKLNEEK